MGVFFYFFFRYDAMLTIGIYQSLWSFGVNNCGVREGMVKYSVSVFVPKSICGDLWSFLMLKFISFYDYMFIIVMRNATAYMNWI